VQVVRLHQLLKEAKFSDPNGHHLSPAGEYNLRLGVMKELRPELIATYQGKQARGEGARVVVACALNLPFTREGRGGGGEGVGGVCS
jgi:DNA topoisomerase VI subunit B